MCHLFEEWDNIANGGNLFIGKENLWLIEDSLLAIGVGNKEWRCVTLVVGVAFGDFGLHFKALALLYGYDAIFADLGDDISDELTDFSIASGNSSDLSNLRIVAFDLLCSSIDAFYNFSASSFDALAEIHWVVTGGDKFVGFSEDIVSKNSNGSSAIASDFVELLCGGLDKLCAHLIAEGFLVVIAEIDSFCDGDAIMSNSWSAVAFFDNYVAAFWTEGYLYCVVEGFCAAENFLAGFSIIEYFLCHFIFISL